MASSKVTIPGQTEHTYLVLDALRGVAAISVMLAHYSTYASHGAVYWLPSAYLAVDFFYVLSGFVIGHAYEKQLLAGLTPARFMLRRLIRLYPLYALGLTIAFIVSWALHYPYSVSYFYNILFLPAPPSIMADSPVRFVYPLNAPAFSLAQEIVINLVYGFLCAHLSTKRLIAYLAIIGTLLVYVLYHFNTGNIGALWLGYPESWVRVAWSFPMGILIYRWVSARKRNPIEPYYAPLLACFLFGILACFRSGALHSALSCLFLFPALVRVGAGTAIFQPAKQIYVWLGRVSYALYILHMPIWLIDQKLLEMLHIDTDTHLVATVALCSLVTIASASLIDVYFDLPLRAYLTRKLLLKRVKAGAA